MRQRNGQHILEEMVGLHQYDMEVSQFTELLIICQGITYIEGLRHTKPTDHESTFRIIAKDTTCERVRLSNYNAVLANPHQLQQLSLATTADPHQQLKELSLKQQSTTETLMMIMNAAAALIPFAA